MRQVRFLLKGKHQLSSTHPIQNLVGFVEEEDIGKLVAAILAPSDNTTTYLGQTINGISELAKPTSPLIVGLLLRKKKSKKQQIDHYNPPQ